MAAGPAALGQITLQTAPVASLLPEIDGPTNTPESESADYLIVRGEARARVPSRRKVVPVATTSAEGSGRTVRPARILSHSAGFSRATRRASELSGVPASETPIEPSKAPDAAPSRAEAPRSRLAPASVTVASLVLGFLVAAGLVALRNLDASTPATTPARRATAEHRGSSGGADGLFDVQVTAVEADRVGGFVRAAGVLTYRGSEPVRRVELSASLLADGVPLRRREVACCEAFGREAAAQIAREPRHEHFRHGAAGNGAMTAGSRPFTVVFPAIDAAAIDARLEVEVEVRIVYASASL